MVGGVPFDLSTCLGVWSSFCPLPATILNDMMHFTTFLALVIGGMEVVQPTAAAVLVGLTGRMDLGRLTFQRRQTTGGGIPQVPAQCESVCDPINTILETNTCPPSQCCLTSFETGYFNCFVCIAMAVDLTDYTEPQSFIDGLYDQCASLGFLLPVLTFPGQNPNRTLSSVVLTSTSLIAQTTIGPSTSTSTSSSATAVSQITVAPSAPTPTPTSSSTSSGPRTETSCFNLIASVMMLGVWFYFGAQ